MFEFLFRSQAAEAAKAERRIREYRASLSHNGHAHLPPNIYRSDEGENTASDRAVERAFRGRRGEA